MNCHHIRAHIVYIKVLNLLSAMIQNLPLNYRFPKMWNCKNTFSLLYANILQNGTVLRCVTAPFRH